MVDERPPDWDWVKATHECSAEVMFGILQTLAKRDVAARNGKLAKEQFIVTVDGAVFTVMKAGAGPAKRVRCALTGTAADQLAVWDAERDTTTTYTVGLDARGVCKLRRDDDELDPWQVLKAALEPLLFR